MILTSSELTLFLSKFSIYRKKYNKKINDSWIMQDFYLTDEKLLNSINNKDFSNLAYFSCYRTNFFVCDIDNHDCKNNLTQIYQEVLNKLGTPTLISKSPRGLHLYYSINRMYSADLLLEYLELKFLNSKYKNQIDFLPTSDLAIRTFNIHNLLDVSLDSIKDKSFSEILLDSHSYDLNELFFDISLKKKNSKKSASSKNWSSIENGETNEAIKCLIPIWKHEGYSLKDCVYKFQEKLSPNYIGQCLRTNTLEKRLKSFFRKEVTWIENRKPLDLDYFRNKYKSQINKALSLLKENRNSSKIQEKNLENLILSILVEKERTEEKYSDIRSRAYYSSKYSFWEFEVGKGNTPLPAKMLSGIVANYQYYLNFLFSIGFLSRKNGRSYDSIKGSCQYYFINSDFDKKYSEFAYSKYSDVLHTKNVSSITRTDLSIKSVVSLLYSVLILSFRSTQELVKENICYNMFLNFNSENEYKLLNNTLFYDT